MSYRRDEKGRFLNGFKNPTRQDRVKLFCQQCNKQYEKRKLRINESRFCSRSCCGKWTYENKLKKVFNYDRTGKKNPFWKGGVRMAQGYRFLFKPDHPRANDKGYVQEHRLVMEKYIGRYLMDKERVHHVNGIKTDNRIENLKLFKNQSEHIKEHTKYLIEKRWQNHS